MYDVNFLNNLIDLLIPAGSGGEPAGSQSRAADYIVGYIDGKREYYEELAVLLNELSEIEKPGEGILRKHEQHSARTFRRLVDLVYTAYYGDPDIVEKRGLPKPPQPHGHKMKPFNMELVKDKI